MREFIKNNVKLLVILGIIILLSAVGITIAYRSNDVGVVIQTGEYGVVYTGSATLPSSKLTPIYDDELLNSVNADKIMKVDFTVKGAESNPSNKPIIYDVTLSELYLPLELRSPHLKWRLYKNGSLHSSGNFSKEFDAIVDYRMVLTNIQQDLPSYSSTADSYTFYMWISEPCTAEDISECSIEEHNLNPFLDKKFSGNIRIELSTETPKELVREKGYNWEENELSYPTLVNLGLEDSYKGHIPNITTTSKLDGTTGIYAAKDDLGMSYYFRGNVTNNYVKFGKNTSDQDMWWRIVRINGDGTVRLIYDGTSAHANSEESTDRQVGTSAFNTNYDANAYVGYMYGTPNSATYELEHANTTDSTIKDYIDAWYESVFKDTDYEQYIADAIYCNDRTMVTDETVNSMMEASPKGYGTEVTMYSFWNRMDLNLMAETEEDMLKGINPTLKCERVNDRFSKKGLINGVQANGKLTYPIALLTVDELAFGGKNFYLSDTFINDQTYLYNGGNWYWTLSPGVFGDGVASVFSGGVGAIGGYNVFDSLDAVRPSITLASDALQYGSGSSTDPYRVIE